MVIRSGVSHATVVYCPAHMHRAYVVCGWGSVRGASSILSYVHTRVLSADGVPQLGPLVSGPQTAFRLRSSEGEVICKCLFGEKGAVDHRPSENGDGVSRARARKSIRRLPDTVRLHPKQYQTLSWRTGASVIRSEPDRPGY